MAKSDWNIERLLFGLMLIVVGMLTLVILPESDTWWLLRAGQDLWRTHEIVTVDTYTYTIRGLEWPNHEWLSQAVMYAFYALGGIPTLVLGMASVLCLAWYGIYKLCDGPVYVRSITIILAVIGNVIAWSLRPHVFSILFTVLMLHMIKRRKYHWFIPLLMIIWVNFHGGFAIGIMILAAATGAALLKERTQFWHWFLISSVSVVATLVNPHGLDLWRFVLSYINHPAKQYIQEWQPPQFSHISGFIYLYMVIMIGLALWFGRHKWRSHLDFTIVLSSMLFVLMASSAVRHLNFLGLIAAPLMSFVFRDRAALAAVTTTQARLNQIIVGIVWTLMLLVVVFSWRNRTIGLEPQLLSALDQCEGPLYNSYDIGGELIWFKPERPVFIDNRHDPYPQTLLQTVIRAESSGEYQALFDQYNIRCAVIIRETALETALLRDNWTQVYTDQIATILAKNP